MPIVSLFIVSLATRRKIVNTPVGVGRRGIDGQRGLIGNHAAGVELFRYSRQRHEHIARRRIARRQLVAGHVGDRTRTRIENARPIAVVPEHLQRDHRRHVTERDGIGVRSTERRHAIQRHHPGGLIGARAGRPNENGGREHDATCSTTQPTSGRHTERAHQILLIVVLSRYEKFPRTVLCRVRTTAGVRPEAAPMLGWFDPTVVSRGRRLAAAQLCRAAGRSRCTDANADARAPATPPRPQPPAGPTPQPDAAATRTTPTPGTPQPAAAPGTPQPAAAPGTPQPAAAPGTPQAAASPTPEPSPSLDEEPTEQEAA